MIKSMVFEFVFGELIIQSSTKIETKYANAGFEYSAYSVSIASPIMAGD